MHVAVLFFFNDTATTEIYTLSLHDALPIFGEAPERICLPVDREHCALFVEVFRASALPRALGHGQQVGIEDRKSTRLNSSHANISYAVFCLEKKKTGTRSDRPRWLALRSPR